MYSSNNTNYNTAATDIIQLNNSQPTNMNYQTNIIRNRKTPTHQHVPYQKTTVERLPSISEWFEQEQQQPSPQQIHTCSVQQQQQTLFHTRQRSVSNEMPYYQNTCPTAMTNMSIDKSGTVEESTNYPPPHHPTNTHQQSHPLKLLQTHQRGKIPHSRVRSVPAITATHPTTTTHPILSNWNVQQQTNNINTLGQNSTIIDQQQHPSMNISPIIGTPQQWSNLNNSTNIINTNMTSAVINNNNNNNKQSSSPQCSSSKSEQSLETKNEFVLVIENAESIKQYSERASLHNPNPFNPLSRRISAKEVWNSIAAATQANKSLLHGSPISKIKKQNKMGGSNIGTLNSCAISNSNISSSGGSTINNSSHSVLVRNRSSSPTSSSNNSTFSNSSSIPVTPLSSITIRTRKRSSSSPIMLLPFEKLTLEEKHSSPTLNSTSTTIQPQQQQNNRPEYVHQKSNSLSNPAFTSCNNGMNSSTQFSPNINLLGNEFVDFSNGEHESQKKNRGEKVFKFKMINFQ